MGRIDGDGERGGPVVGIEAVAAAEELAEGGFDRGQPFVEFDAGAGGSRLAEVAQELAGEGGGFVDRGGEIGGGVTGWEFGALGLQESQDVVPVVNQMGCVVAEEEEFFVFGRDDIGGESHWTYTTSRVCRRAN